MSKKTVGWSVKEFLAWKRSQGVADSTYEHYRSRTRVLLGPLAAVKLKKLTREALLEPLHANDEGKRRATRSASRRALSNYQRWLLREELIVEPLLTPEDLRSHGTDRRQRFATDKENEQILSVVKRDYRLLYMAQLLTGARPGELVNATIDEIHEENGRRTIIPKHHKTEHHGAIRFIPIRGEVNDIVDEAIGGRTEGRIFLRANGQPWTVQVATTRFRVARRQCGIPEHIKPYLARHAFITKTAKEKGETKAAALAGHKSTAMVHKHYLLWRPEDMHDFAG
jgi:integrase